MTGDYSWLGQHIEYWDKLLQIIKLQSQEMIFIVVCPKKFNSWLIHDFF